MRLKSKVFILTLTPLLVISSLFIGVTGNQFALIADRESKTLAANMLHERQNSLKHHVQLASQVIEQIESSSLVDEDEFLLHAVKALRFGDNGYFYIYDDKGKNIAHPILPELEGRNLIDLKDPNGNNVIRSLLDAARYGNGYHEYLWYNPSTKEVEPKLGYALWLPDKKWILGTGFYIKDIDQQVKELRDVIESSMHRVYKIFISVLIVIIILIVIVALAINLHESYASDFCLRELTYKNVMLQEESRKKLSRELHDGVNQLIISAKCHMEVIKISLQRNKPIHVLKHVTSSEESLIEAINEVRRISRQLRPSALDDIGLIAAVKCLTDDFFAAHNTEVTLSLDAKLPWLPNDISTSLYRVVQESIVNVSKHTDSRAVTIKLDYSPPSVLLSIKDKGQGFHVERALSGEGIGLRNMKERIEYIGGEFQVWSKPGEGTEILVTVHIPENIHKKGKTHAENSSYVGG